MGHHGHHWEHHHHGGHHHHGMGRGMFFFPFVPMLFGLFVLFLIFKTGLWLPLLLIGAFMFFVRPRMMGRGGMGQWNGMNRGDWHAMREKMKREWTQGEVTESPDKPKRGNDGIEYV